MKGIVVVVSSFVVWTMAAQAQEPGPEPVRLDPARRAAIVEAAAGAIERIYFDPGIGARTAGDLRRRLAAGAFDRCEDPVALAAALGEAAVEASGDRRLSIRPPGQTGWTEGADPVLDPDPATLARAASRNHGLERAERLAGNVGYLRVTGLASPPAASGDTFRAAMEFLGGTDALLIDVRGCQGGSPATIAFLAGWFFESPIAMTSIAYRDGGRVETFASAATVPGRRYGKPVYILTGPTTENGAEAFAYDLQAARRATVVGAATAGAANPTTWHRIDVLSATIPAGRAVHPATGRSWEGAGVTPDVPSAAEDAYRVGYDRALRDLLGDGTARPGADEVRAALKALRPVDLADAEDTMVEVTARGGPVPVSGTDGLVRLVYELHLTNVDLRLVDVRLVRVEVRADGEAGELLASHEGSDLAGLLGRPLSALGDHPDPFRIAPERRLVVFLFLAVPEGRPVPARLVHRLLLRRSGSDRESSVDAFAVDVGPPAIALGPPLAGGGWIATEGPGRANHHRNGLVPRRGGLFVPQRFAIDWMRLFGDGQVSHGDPTRNESFAGYGAPAIAVADAVVASVLDGLPDNVPGTVPPLVELSRANGNQVTLDLGGGRYALYAHLQPGSLRVARGDRVRRGQVLGLVGNSGNSTAPHLHFHVVTSSDPLGGEGVPYAIDAFELQVPATDVWSRMGPTGPALAFDPASSGVALTARIPLQLDVVRFPE